MMWAAAATPDSGLAGIVAVMGVVAAVLASLLTFWASHRKTNVDGKNALDKRIDDRVAIQLESAWGRIDSLERRVKDLELNAKVVRQVVRAWFQKLVRWDKGGRHGKLPVPSDQDMVTIGIDDLALIETSETPVNPSV